MSAVMANADQTAGAQPKRLRLTLIAIYTAIVALAGTFSIPPLDRDEARFAQATVQMLETGDYINIRFQDDERNKKPVGIYWLQAASVSLFSDAEARAIWAYRLPSLLAAVLSAMLAYSLGCRLFKEETAFLGTLLLVVAPSFSGEATIAKTDAALLTTVLAMQLALARLYLDGFLKGERVGLPTILLFWGALAAGILIKGPITPMIGFLTIVSLGFVHLRADLSSISRLLHWALSFRPITGLLILLVIVAPWMLAIGIETEGRFFAEALGGDMLDKVSEPQESHSGPFGYYLLVVWIMFWPGSIFLPMALRHAATNRLHAGTVFCLCWLLPSWLVFEIASTKLPHYTLPLYPALALLVAQMLTTLAGTEARKSYWLSRSAGSMLYLIVAGLVAALIIYGMNTFSVSGAGRLEYGFAATVVLGAVITVFLFWRDRLKSAALTTSLVGAVTAWILFQGILPRLDDLRLSPALAEILSDNDLHPIKNDAPPVALLGYYEPSAIFLIGTDSKITIPETAADWLRAAPGHVAIVESRQEKVFLSALGPTSVRKLAVLEGYNYSNAIDVVLTVYISE